MKEETKNWLQIAKEHYDNALFLYEGSRYSLAVYCCHQALEAILKAAIVEFVNIVPPKNHNLDALARATQLDFPSSWLEELAEITRHYWRVRYPDFRRYVYKDKEKVKPTVDKTKEVYTWILSKLNQN